MVKKLKDPTSFESVSRCTMCPNLAQDHVPAEGDPDSSLMIIGQSPGSNEVKAQRPFVGACGEIVDYMLDEAGITRSMAYITNALKCHPPNNRAGLSGELANCWREWLLPELKMVKPKLVLVLGGDAHRAVLPSDVKFGHLVETVGKKSTYLSSYHPGWFLRRGAADEFVTDVGSKVKMLLENLDA